MTQKVENYTIYLNVSTHDASCHRRRRKSWMDTVDYRASFVWHCTQALAVVAEADNRPIFRPTQILAVQPCKEIIITL